MGQRSARPFSRKRAGLYFDTSFRSGRTPGLRQVPEDASGCGAEPRENHFRGGTSFPVWGIKGVNVGVIICYHYCFPETARCATINGAEFVLGPFAAPRFPTWTISWSRAPGRTVYMAPTNKVGLEGEWIFGGRSMIVDPFGEMVGQASDEANDVIVTRGVARTRLP
jgi:predicted amidohydrolase